MSKQERLTTVSLNDWIDWKENDVTQAFLQRFSTALDATLTSWASGAMIEDQEIWQARAVVYKSVLDLAYNKDGGLVTSREEADYE
jgi:hypothetical protein